MCDLLLQSAVRALANGLRVNPSLRPCPFAEEFQQHNSTLVLKVWLVSRLFWSSRCSVEKRSCFLQGGI